MHTSYIDTDTGKNIMSLFRYKGFYGSAQASIEDHCLFGKLEFIEPLVSYEGQNIEELEQAFKDTVDAYLLDCEKLGREPARLMPS